MELLDNAYKELVDAHVDMVIEAGDEVSDDEHDEYMNKHYGAYDDIKVNAVVAMAWGSAAKDSAMVEQDENTDKLKVEDKKPVEAEEEDVLHLVSEKGGCQGRSHEGGEQRGWFRRPSRTLRTSRDC